MYYRKSRRKCERMESSVRIIPAGRTDASGRDSVIWLFGSTKTGLEFRGPWTESRKSWFWSTDVGSKDKRLCSGEHRLATELHIYHGHLRHRLPVFHASIPVVAESVTTLTGLFSKYSICRLVQVKHVWAQSIPKSGISVCRIEDS